MTVDARERQQIDGDGKGDMSTLARIEVDPGEAFEFEYRSRDARNRITHVELRDLGTGSVALVRQRERHHDLAVDGNLVRIDLQIVVRKGRVRQTVTEREHETEVVLARKPAGEWLVVVEDRLGAPAHGKETVSLPDGFRAPVNTSAITAAPS